MGLDLKDKALRETLLEEIETEIEMARERLIPPSWQSGSLQKLRQAAERHWITEQEYNDLRVQFVTAIHSGKQISDREYSRQVAADSAGNALFYWCDKGNSTVTIERDGDGYSAIVYLNVHTLGKATARASAEQCILELEEYAAAHGFSPAPVTEQQCRGWCPPNHIASREEAFGYALAMLREYRK